MLLELSIASVLLYALYTGVVAVYRVWWHPLSTFPGPRAAAISRSWQAGIMRSRFPEEQLAQYHQEYNTQALRIGPNELHITDPSLYRVIYSQTHPFPKDPLFYSMLVAIPKTLPTELDFEKHRFKRRLLNPLFSKAGVEKLCPVFLGKIQHMSAKLEKLQTEGAANAVDVGDMFRSLMVDIISEFAFGFSLNQLDEKPKDFRTGYLQAFDKAIDSVRLFQFNTVARFIAANTPLKLVGLVNETTRKMAELEDTARYAVKMYMQGKTSRDVDHPVIFDFIAGKIPEHDLMKESLVLLVAGGDTTAFALACAMHYILSNKDIKERLVRELDEIVAKLGRWPSSDELEHITYLNAVVSETLRMATPVAGMLPRTVPSSPAPALVVDGKPVPAGTIVGMSAFTMHRATSIWGADASRFDPDRWLKVSKEEHARLESHLVTFSKGTRQCIAKTMATVEITMTLAWLFSNFKMTLRTKDLVVKDTFNASVEAPGVLIDFEVRKK